VAAGDALQVKHGARHMRARFWISGRSGAPCLFQGKLDKIDVYVNVKSGTCILIAC
jgi:hypothetical protein